MRLLAASIFPAALITVGLLVSVQLGGNWTWLAAAFVLALVAGLVVGLLEYRGPGPVDAEVLRAHLAAGREAELETHLREAADRRDAMRRWGARVQLVELLLAQRRTADAAVEMDAETMPVPAALRASVALCRAELRALAGEPDEALLQEIVSERHAAVQAVGAAARNLVEPAWCGVQGLVLCRMGRYRDAEPLLATGVDHLAHRASHVIYVVHHARALEALGDDLGARDAFDRAARAFPGSPYGHESRRWVELHP